MTTGRINQVTIIFETEKRKRADVSRRLSFQPKVKTTNLRSTKTVQQRLSFQPKARNTHPKQNCLALF
jgi:hypothetical protein